jgi:hypothetical protein
MESINQDYLYAIVETADKSKGGLFASTDRGASWEKKRLIFQQQKYYQEIFCDPKDL